MYFHSQASNLVPAYINKKYHCHSLVDSDYGSSQLYYRHSLVGCGSSQLYLYMCVSVCHTHPYTLTYILVHKRMSKSMIRKLYQMGRTRSSQRTQKKITYLITKFNIICKILNHEMFPALQFF